MKIDTFTNYLITLNSGEQFYCAVKHIGHDFYTVQRQIRYIRGTWICREIRDVLKKDVKEFTAV